METKQPPPQIMRYDQHDFDQHKPAYTFPVMDMSQPPPGYPPTLPADHSAGGQTSVQKDSPLEDGEQADSEVEFVERTG
jgi:hypothetical protein